MSEEQFWIEWQQAILGGAWPHGTHPVESDPLENFK